LIGKSGGKARKGIRKERSVGRKIYKCYQKVTPTQTDKIEKQSFSLIGDIKFCGKLRYVST